MIPGKVRRAVFKRLCDCCDKTVGQSRVVYEAGGEVRVFCSEACMREHFGWLTNEESRRVYYKEQNALTKLVCPACRARIRRKG